MSEHTPGPWEWYWRGEDGQADCGVLSGADSGRARSICRAPRYETKEQWEVNARLIAAAPDLLEALQVLLGATEGLFDSRDDMDDIETIKIARTAISKATS